MASSQSEQPDGSCQLHLKRNPDSQLQLNGNLTRKTGDFWLSYISLESLDVALACVRTEFRVDASGEVAAIGVDVRMEDENSQLVWFDRVER